MSLVTKKEAKVKTLSVEVKALMIGTKQVTLAVFRQLLHEQVIDAATGQFKGVPWGRVNYRWGGCAGKGQDHLHVVWQKGDELRRACVERDPLRHDLHNYGQPDKSARGGLRRLHDRPSQSGCGTNP